MKQGRLGLDNLKGFSRAVVAERRLGRLGNVEAFAGRGASAPALRLRRRQSTRRAGCATARKQAGYAAGRRKYAGGAL
jgi:hypothetical protein